MTEDERNLQAAESIRRDPVWKDRSVRPDEFVALLDGRIIAVESSAAGAIAGLRTVDPDPRRGMVIVVGPSSVDVIRAAGDGSPDDPLDFGPWTENEMDLLAAETADLLVGDGFDEPDDPVPAPGSSVDAPGQLI